jgi:hypothetical protein
MRRRPLQQPLRVNRRKKIRLARRRDRVSGAFAHCRWVFQPESSLSLLQREGAFLVGRGREMIVTNVLPIESPENSLKHRLPLLNPHYS